VTDYVDDCENKLTRSKMAWAEEGRFLTGAHVEASVRLPPGQHLTSKWPVLDLGIVPHVAHAEWQLHLTGLKADPVSLGWREFLDLPQRSFRSDIHCVTSWSRYDNDWDGIATSDLLAAFPPRDDAKHVMLQGADGYVTNVTLDDFARPDAMLAHSWNGLLLDREHGAPVRMVIPHLYFWKSAKWIERIEYVVDDRPGFWELRGYHNRGDPWMEERYS
jgi:DMSO/TMAO reductase YedYZ molybdopterin-dependent catalytic subunit